MWLDGRNTRQTARMTRDVAQLVCGRRRRQCRTRWSTVLRHKRGRTPDDAGSVAS